MHASDVLHATAYLLHGKTAEAFSDDELLGNVLSVDTTVAGAYFCNHSLSDFFTYIRACSPVVIFFDNGLLQLQS
jgi:hypothetical protein